MELTTQKAQTQIKNLIAKAVEKAFSAGVLPGAESAPFIIEIPADKRNGDFSTNAAMVNAKNFRLPPRKIAETIVSFASNEDTYFEKIEVA
ncbi:MAG: arginine--tRNA ligase, partial [Clostridia bacterium]|nr:arginine--tRNA ligase [Clostridia bacterium]